MATNKRINVLVYTGEGTTSTSLQHVFFTFRQLLSPTYVVLSISSTALLKEPWEGTCAALIIPGGADLPYCRRLNGEGNRRIKQFVQNGGRYIGLCAGGYYGSSRCEFMLGHKVMEVVGDRELQFYPGTCRGLAFKGFKYQSEAGARAVELRVNSAALKILGSGIPDTFRSYYNGGGVFVDAPKYEDQGVEILASYSESLDCDAGQGSAAIVYRKVGDGHVLLTGPHPEFAPTNLDKNSHGETYKVEVEKIEKDENNRQAILKACLMKLNLEVNQSSQPVPLLSPLHLTSLDRSQISALVSQWKTVVTRIGDTILIQGDNDIFQLKNFPTSLYPAEMEESTTLDEKLSSVKISSSDQEAENESGSDRIVDYNKVTKHLIIYDHDVPSFRETSKFNHEIFYSSLEKYMGTKLNRSSFGKYLLYGEVVTSTSTMLEKNNSLLQTLPTGFTATASTQVSGRGRGSNVWVSPPGSLMFSTVIWHPVALSHSSPVVFVQYLAAMAVVRGAKTYARGYDKLPLRLKWPNDVYAEDLSSEKSFVKVGGILVNSSYSGEKYGLVVGVGVNVANKAPTIGLDALAKNAGLPVFEPEKLLARILTSFEELYVKFVQEGWGSQLESMYYEMWLHNEQIVTLASEGGLRARIKGITRDWGLLLAEELGWEDR